MFRTVPDLFRAQADDRSRESVFRERFPAFCVSTTHRATLPRFSIRTSGAKGVFMTIAEQIDKDYVEAYKAHEKTRLGTLRLLKTAAKNRQVELMRPLTDEDYLDVLLKQAKQRQDSIEQYQNAGRSDLAEAEAAELEILRGYLPRPLSQEELDAVVARAVEPLLDGGMKMMGKAIQAIMGEYRGRVDGKAVSDAVKARFQAAGR